MRPSFQRNIEAYSEIARDAMRADLTDEDMERLQHVLDWRIDQASKARASTPEAQYDVYTLQWKKQEAMRRLKEDIARLDEPEYVPERIKGDRRIVCEGGKYYWKGAAKGLPGDEVTLGELMTDGSWGIRYYLDPVSVPRGIRKRYLVEAAKAELRAELDAQICADETSSQQTDPRKRGTYMKIARRNSSFENLTPMEFGLITERMVENFLVKLAYDLDTDFEVLEADVFQDVEQKIDFIIKRKRRRRGVGVSEKEEGGNIGIQFTGLGPEKLGRKMIQIDRAKREMESPDGPEVDDIVLVSIPRLHGHKVYEQWHGSKNCGGPDKLWPPEVKEKIFRGVMQGILAPQEIDAEWGAIAQRVEAAPDITFPMDRAA